MKRFARVLFIVAVSLVAVGVIGALVVQTPWVKDYLRGVAERQATRALGAQVSIGSLGGNLFTGAVLRDVSVAGAGQPVVRVPSITVEYSLWDLLRGDVDVRRIAIREPLIHLRRTAEGAINLAAVARPPRDDTNGTAGPGRGWAIGEIAVEDGTMTIGPRVVTSDAVNLPERLTDLDVTLAARSNPAGPGLVLDIASLSFHAQDPALTLTDASGGLLLSPGTFRFDDLRLPTSAGLVSLDGAVTNRQTTPSYDLDLHSKNLSFDALAPIVPALDPYDLSPTIDASVDGPADRLATQFAIETKAGQVSGDVTLDVTGPGRRFRGKVQTTGLNLAALRPAGGTDTDLTLNASLDLEIPSGDLSGLRGTYRVQAPEVEYGTYAATNVTAEGRIDNGMVAVKASADAYGGRAAVTGSVRLPADGAPLHYDLDTTFRNVDPARLPADLRPGTLRRTGQPLPLEETSPDGRGGIDVDVRVRGTGTAIDSNIRLRDVSLAGADFSEDTRISVSRERGRTTYSAAGTVRGLDLQRLGRELGIAPLDAPRFDSAINATFDIRGAGTELESLTLQGRATLTDSQLFGARVPALTVYPDITRGGGTIGVEGRFTSLDLSQVGGTALKSNLGGAIDATLTIDDLADPAFSLETLDGRARLTLRDSSVSSVRIERAIIDAALADSRATIAQFIVEGPDLEIRLEGAVALNRRGSSRLEYFVATPALQRFEQLDMPARGDVRLAGTLTGNLERLTLQGTLAGTHVGYAGVRALSIKSAYSVAIPELTPARARVDARTELTSVEVGGRRLTSVKAKTEYADRTLVFDSQIQERRRAIDAEGTLVWRPEVQQLRLRRFGLQTPDSRWELAHGAEARVEYGAERLSVADLTLTSAAGGRISVEGGLGVGAHELRASIDGLQLNHIDEFFLEEPLSGMASATAVVRGSFERPVVTATISVVDGAYRGIAFERLAGDVAYRESLLDVDIALTQSAGAVLRADGVVPLSVASGAQLDVVITSSPVDLALVSAFTDEVEDVAGTAALDLRVTGSLAAPRVHGTLDVHGGAFTVALARSRYHGFDTTLEFASDRLRVREFQLIDDEGNRLRIGGQIGLGQGRRDLDVRLRSEDFEIADNRLAELNLDTDVRVTGTLMRPSIEGTVGIAGGTIHVDRILELLHGPYVGSEPGPASQQPGVFAPTVSLAITVPDTLIVRGSDLRAAGGVPIGLGDVNVTLGGDVSVRKRPGEDLALVGDVQAVRGTYDFQGRRFDIARGGRIEFIGGGDIDPRLDLTATREISGVVASVHIGGVLSEPELRLSSRPPMEDAQVLSLIVFNQPLSLLGTGEQVSLAARATALATGFVASELTQSVGEALELDVLELQTTTPGTTGLAPVLTVGEQFGQLFLKLRQRFGPEAVSEAVLEYRFAEWLRLQTSFAQGQSARRSLLQRLEAGGLDLLFWFSY